MTNRESRARAVRQRPDGRVEFILLPNAERLTFKVTMRDTAVIEASPLVMKLDGYDLSSAGVFNKVERPQSEIGELAVYARRKGNIWFLAVMNGPQPKTRRVPLSFLGEGEYKAVTVRDDPTDDAGVQMETTTRKRADSLDINLREGGGLLARFSPLE